MKKRTALKAAVVAAAATAVTACSPGDIRYNFYDSPYDHSDSGIVDAVVAGDDGGGNWFNAGMQCWVWNSYSQTWSTVWRYGNKVNIENVDEAHLNRNVDPDRAFSLVHAGSADYQCIPSTLRIFRAFTAASLPPYG